MPVSVIQLFFSLSKMYHRLYHAIPLFDEVVLERWHENMN